MNFNCWSNFLTGGLRGGMTSKTSPRPTACYLKLNIQIFKKKNSITLITLMLARAIILLVLEVRQSLCSN